jgi:hypothetical protein
MTLQHQFANHFTWTTNYTWSHCVSSWDFAGELAGVIYQNPLNRATGERGNCGYDHRQNFISSLVAVSPGVGRGLAKRLTLNWQLSPVVSFFTGNPLQLSDGKDISLSGQGLDRPSIVDSTQVFQVPQGGIAPYWFNPSAFVCAGNTVASPCSTFTGLFGSVGRNSMYGPGQIRWDMALSRRFAFTERWQLDFRADFFNIMNHANWGNPGTSVSSAATFGEVTTFYPSYPANSNNGPRIIQMALKLYF